MKSFRQNARDIKRIQINLFSLKPKKSLKTVYDFYKKFLSSFFDSQGNPRPDFFQKTPCPICHSKKEKGKITIDNFVYVRCARCGGIYNNPRIRPEFLEKMYASGHYQTYFKKFVVSRQKIRKEIIEVRKYKQIAIYFRKPGSILDVGCGSGSFLRNFQDKGWKALGIEPSAVAKKFAEKKYRVKVQQAFFENFTTKEKFDCITFWGLEHLSDPMGGLRKAIRMLKPNGLIVFESPSADSFLMSYLGEFIFSPYRYIEHARHILFFSRSSIEYICKTMRSRLLNLESNGLDIQTILSEDFGGTLNQKILNMQTVLDRLLLGDHYRVFLCKEKK